MKIFLNFLMTTTCILGFSDGFAPIDYAPMEEAAASDAHLLSYAETLLEDEAIAEKEWYPPSASSSVNLGADPQALPKQSNTPNTGKGIFPPEESTPTIPTPEMPTPSPKPQPNPSYP